MKDSDIVIEECILFSLIMQELMQGGEREREDGKFYLCSLTTYVYR